MSEGGGLTQRIRRLDWRGGLMVLVAIAGAGVLAALVLNQYFAANTRDTALPVDLAGCTARMHVRPELESETILLALTTENGGIQLGGMPGHVQLFLSAEQTALLTWESGVYDLEVEFTDGDVRRLFAGSVKVSPEVTRG